MFERSQITQKADVRASIGADILKETINILKKRPRRRLEEPEEQGESSGNRRHEVVCIFLENKLGMDITESMQN